MTEAWKKFDELIKARRKTDRFVRVTCQYREITETHQVDVAKSFNTLAELEADARAYGTATHRAARAFKDNHGIHRCTKVKFSVAGPFLHQD
jgi:hypothetical protein